MFVREASETPQGIMKRAAHTFGDRVEKVVVITLSDDAQINVFSNASSQPEVMGLLWSVLRGTD